MTTRKLTIAAALLLFSYLEATPQRRAEAHDRALARRGADLLVDQIERYTRDNPDVADALPEWIGAEAGDPLPVFGYGQHEPSYALVPVIANGGETVGYVGIHPATGQWRWYAEAGTRDPAFRSQNEILTVARRHVGQTVPAPVLEPRLVSMADRNLYWYFSWSDSVGALREIFVHFWDAGRVYTERTRDSAGLTEGWIPSLSSEPRSVQTESVRRISPLRDRELPDVFSIEVPHYYQRTPYNCAPASLQMVLDYWGPEIVQREIASAANTTPRGTLPDDLIRACRFSHTSTANLDPLLVGYTNRRLGYASAAAQWGDPGLYETRYVDLKNLVYDGYPVVMVNWFDETYTAGHARVLKGYNDRVGSFILHDPWYSGVYMGPDLFIEQSFLVDILWVIQGIDRWALMTAPWAVTVSTPDSVDAGESFLVRAQIEYRGPYPYIGSGKVHNSKVTLEVPSGLKLEEGSEAIQDMKWEGISGSVDSVAWRVSAMVDGGDVLETIRITASGLISDSSPSYETYTDEIGGTREAKIYRRSGITVRDVDVDARPGHVAFVFYLGSDVDLEDLKLTALRAGSEWTIPLRQLESNCFSGEDSSRQLAAGGSVAYSLRWQQHEGEWTELHGRELELDSTISRTRLLGGLPNPARLPVSVSFQVNDTERVRISVYDTAGRTVATLVDQVYEVGWHDLVWDGRTLSGSELASGIYLVRMEAASCSETRRLVVMK